MEDNEEFEVDKIVAQRENHGCIEYKIRWKNYGPDFDTWEPESNLIGCDQVLKNFKIQHAMESFTVKEEVEDGEVSGSDSSEDALNEHSSSRRSKKNKKKKSKRKNSLRENADGKGESHPALATDSVNDNFGIKVEVAVENKSKEKPALSMFSTNFSMGASELLHSYSSIPMSMINQTESIPMCKEELHHVEDTKVFVKEEKSFLEYADERIECNDSDSDSDLDGQLKVVINDEIYPPVTPVTEAVPATIAVPPLDVQTDQSRSWRDHHGVFKIRKSQRKDDPNLFPVEETPTVLARDRWPLKVKDSQAEAFYNLPLVSSLSEARAKVEKDNLVIKNAYTVLTKEALFRAVEEGNTIAVWSSYLCSQENDDPIVRNGDLLILAARFGYSDIVGIVLKAGTNVNYQNEDGVTALMAAAEFGHESVCHLLIENGAFVNTFNSKNESAITKAVSRGNTDCLLVLLHHGCDVFNVDSDKGPLQMARQRNLHEMEVLITEYGQRLSENLTQLFVSLTNSSISVSYVLFPLRVVSTFESDEFNFEFSAKIPPVRDDECNLLAIFSGFVQDKQLKYCLDKECNLKSVSINDIEQQSLFPNGSCSITTMAPILDGKNTLNIKCNSRINCRWVRMLVIGFRIKIVDKVQT